MPQFALLLRGEDIDFPKYSPEDYQRLISDFDVWNARLEKKGLLASAGLKGVGAKTLRERDGHIATDGPYCDTKEAITGICIIQADDPDDAHALAQGCPFLSRGGSVEVRPISNLEISQLFPESSR